MEKIIISKNGLNYNVKVKFNVEVERCIDGQRWHLVETHAFLPNDIWDFSDGSNVESSSVEDKDLVEYLKHLEIRILEGKFDTPEPIYELDKRLLSLGYS